MMTSIHGKSCRFCFGLFLRRGDLLILKDIRYSSDCKLFRFTKEDTYIFLTIEMKFHKFTI